MALSDKGDNAVSIYVGSDKIKDVYIGSDKIKKIYVGSDLVYEAGGGLPAGYTDTGLGWAAKTEFLINDSTTVFCQDTVDNYKKENSGYAIVVGIIGETSTTTGPVVISTVDSYVRTLRGSTAYNAIENMVGYLGTTWYMNFNVRNSRAKTFPTGIQTISYASLPSSHSTVFQDIMTAAGVIIYP